MNVFDFVNSITYNKKDLFEDPLAEKDYVPFIVNRGLSYFPDTIMFANEMNMHASIPKQWQYDFLRFSITKKRRFSKWAKKGKEEDLMSVQIYYNCSEKKAIELLSLLNQEQLKVIKESISEGGK